MPHQIKLRLDGHGPSHSFLCLVCGRQSPPFPSKRSLDRWRAWHHLGHLTTGRCWSWHWRSGHE